MSGDLRCHECQKTTSGDCGRHGHSIQFGMSDQHAEAAVADASENSRLRSENATLRRRLEELNQLLIQEYEKSNGRRDRLKQTEARLDALRSWLTRVFCEDLRRMMVWKASGHKPS